MGRVTLKGRSTSFTSQNKTNEQEEQVKTFIEGMKCIFDKKIKNKKINVSQYLRKK